MVEAAPCEGGPRISSVKAERAANGLGWVTFLHAMRRADTVERTALRAPTAIPSHQSALSGFRFDSIYAGPACCATMLAGVGLIGVRQTRKTRIGQP